MGYSKWIRRDYLDTLKQFFKNLKYKGELGFQLYIFVLRTYKILTNYIFSDQSYISKKFNYYQQGTLDWNNLKSLNEKMQWFKIYDRNPKYTMLSDKYLAREYFSKEFGAEYLIPLIFETTNAKELNENNLPNYPVVVKANHDSGNYRIIRDKSKVDFHKLQTDAREWLSFNYYWEDREWPYKNIQPRIVVEKLLQTKEGKIPNDYKLNCFNGKVEFVYVSVDREGINKRNIYSKDWKPLDFTWNKRFYDHSKLRGPEIDAPATYSKMIEFAERIAKDYQYVRVDFYDVDGKLYFGEITQYHGGGFDVMMPKEWDYKFGEMIEIKA